MTRADAELGQRLLNGAGVCTIIRNAQVGNFSSGLMLWSASGATWLNLSHVFDSLTLITGRN